MESGYSPNGNEWSAANAVQAKASYTVQLTFSRIFGRETLRITDSSVAAVSGSRRSGCVKPFALPWSELLESLTSLDGVTRPYDHVLTAEEVRKLTSATSPPIVTFRANGIDPEIGDAVPGNMGWVGWGDVTNSTNFIADRLLPSCPANYSPVQVGDLLDGLPGEINAANIRTALSQLCPGGDGWTSRSCGGELPPIEVPIYDQVTGTGTNAKYRINHIGVFKVTGITTVNGGGSGGTKRHLEGYFTGFRGAGDGEFSGYAGPSQITALVR
jgi:hypothetical protein